MFTGIYEERAASILKAEKYLSGTYCLQFRFRDTLFSEVFHHEDGGSMFLRNV
jgi:hypothetical protein